MIEDGTIEGTIRSRALRTLAAVYLPLVCLSGWLAALCLQSVTGSGYAAGLPACLRWLNALVLLAAAAYPFRRLGRSIRWFAFDGRVLRAKRLLTGRVIERPITDIDGVRPVTFGQYGELEGRNIRFADGSTIYFGLSGYSNADVLVDALERSLSRRGAG